MAKTNEKDFGAGAAKLAGIEIRCGSIFGALHWYPTGFLLHLLERVPPANQQASHMTSSVCWRPDYHLNASASAVFRYVTLNVCPRAIDRDRQTPAGDLGQALAGSHRDNVV
jgi:hypothetical protein